MMSVIVDEIRSRLNYPSNYISLEKKKNQFYDFISIHRGIICVLKS